MTVGTLGVSVTAFCVDVGGLAGDVAFTVVGAELVGVTGLSVDGVDADKVSETESTGVFTTVVYVYSWPKTVEVTVAVYRVKVVVVVSTIRLVEVDICPCTVS